MNNNPAAAYLESSLTTPFLLFVGDDQYASTKNDLSGLGLETVTLSSFCARDDKLPDIDGLLDSLTTPTPSGAFAKSVVLGLGEYLALRGSSEAARTLSRIKDFVVGRGKAVFLLRGVTPQLANLQTDPRFDSRRFCVLGKAECCVSLTLVESSTRFTPISGFKSLLAELENGQCRNITVSTAIPLGNSMFTVRKIRSDYEAIRLVIADFAVPSSCGSDAQWSEFLEDLQTASGSLEAVLGRHDQEDLTGTNFFARVTGDEYSRWLYFICLKYRYSSISNSYLRFVLKKTLRFEDFTDNVLNAIIGIPHTDSCFEQFYNDRKELIKKFPESAIASFVVNNRKNVAESLYALTDNTKREREEIIAWVCQNGIPPQLKQIYPALDMYLASYFFKCPELADLLTEYFEAYKRQKISNTLEPEFLAKVEELAQSPRKFNRLPTRNEVIDKLEIKDTCLYWLDSLGVEYMAFIEGLARKNGLSMQVHIARAELPTITSINRDFYEAWQGPKIKNRKLDDTKHSEDSEYNFTNIELPIHLAAELDCIAAVIETISTALFGREYTRVVLASDHGASRLAVLRRKEEKYETNEKGVHSGRCCKLSQPYDLPFAAKENGYLVLADYGRFKGSRAANVEVHGGASLEEAVIPIIEFSLKNRCITVELVNEQVTADFRTGTEIELFINAPVQNVSVVLNRTPYKATQTDTNHHKIGLPNIRRAGEFPADVFAGDDLIGRVTVKVQGKSGKMNDAFNDLF